MLTHGHFDHTGAIEDLLKTWDVPVYAHRLEMPHLTAQKRYPPPDPSAGGGLMAFLAPAGQVFHRKPCVSRKIANVSPGSCRKRRDLWQNAIVLAKDDLEISDGQQRAGMAIGGGPCLPSGLAASTPPEPSLEGKIFRGCSS
jgi:hypothetical protein